MNDTNTGLIACGIVIAVLVIGWAIYESAAETAACERMGGHQNTKWGGGFTSNGDYAATSTTFCLSSDGRVLR